MPSPDLSQYNPLILLDKAPSDLVARALSDAAIKLPGWTPREGNTEMALLETMALTVSEDIFAINRLPDAVVDVVMRLFGITRILGTPGAGAVTFTLSDNLGHTIPAGTRVRLTLASPPDPANPTVDFTTDTAVTAPPGALTVNANVTSVLSTADANGTAAGTPLALVDAVPFVESVAVQTAIGSGAGPEADDQWRSRAVTQFQALTSTLVLPSDFVAAALQWASVYRARGLDQWDPTLAGGAGAAANGHMTVAVLGFNNALLTAGDKTALAASLDLKAYGPLVVHVIDPTITAVAVTATVKALAGYDPAVVHANVIAALNAYLSPGSWPWSGTVRVNELISLIDQAVGVDYVVSVTAPAADVNLTGAAPLATAGTLTVTVT